MRACQCHTGRDGSDPQKRRAIPSAWFSFLMSCAARDQRGRAGARRQRPAMSSRASARALSHAPKRKRPGGTSEASNARKPSPPHVPAPLGLKPNGVQTFFQLYHGLLPTNFLSQSINLPYKFLRTLMLLSLVTNLLTYTIRGTPSVPKYLHVFTRVLHVWPFALFQKNCEILFIFL